MTVSADKQVKIWNMDVHLSDDNVDDESRKPSVCYNIGNELGDMQVGCAWAGPSDHQTLLTISLDGSINYFDGIQTDEPQRKVKGHVKAIVASCLSADKSTLFTASFDGLVYHWNLRTGFAEL